MEWIVFFNATTCFDCEFSRHDVDYVLHSIFCRNLAIFRNDLNIPIAIYENVYFRCDFWVKWNISGDKTDFIIACVPTSEISWTNIASVTTRFDHILRTKNRHFGHQEKQSNTTFLYVVDDDALLFLHSISSFIIYTLFNLKCMILLNQNNNHRMSF